MNEQKSNPQEMSSHASRMLSVTDVTVIGGVALGVSMMLNRAFPDAPLTERDIGVVVALVAVLGCVGKAVFRRVLGRPQRPTRR